MTSPKLFTPIKVGALTLPNRVAMAPLTRNRAKPDGDVPSELAIDYYAQRATAGLIITEGSPISPMGKGYAWTPGIYSDAQMDAWRKVTDAVHAQGGHIAVQLWHVGRISHDSLLNGQAPVAPSAIPAGAKTFDGKGFVETSAPRALETAEIPGIVADFARAASNARAAGFDAVEIHGANGYLIDQFLRDSTNLRTDAYGGSRDNRLRFMTEVAEAVAKAIGADRTGIRLSPFAPANNAPLDSDPMATYGAAIDRLSGLGLAFLHMVEGQTGGSRDLPAGCDVAGLRQRFSGVYIANNGYSRDMAVEAVETGHADMVAFGRAFIANPDLVERLRLNAVLSEGDRTTYYGGGAKGYTDYPTLAA